jgi:hypothetical protein
LFHHKQIWQPCFSRTWRLWNLHQLLVKLFDAFFACYVHFIQGDQIGRNSPNGRLFTLSSLTYINFVLLFSLLYNMYLFWRKGVGLYFGRFFHKLIWSPWLHNLPEDYRLPDLIVHLKVSEKG